MPKLSKEFQEFAGNQDIPIIAFKFATYPNANKGCDMIMDNLDKIHVAKQQCWLMRLGLFSSRKYRQKSKQKETL